MEWNVRKKRTQLTFYQVELKRIADARAKVSMEICFGLASSAAFFPIKTSKTLT